MKKIALIFGVTALLSAPALAGINPASPGLPTASTTVSGFTYTGFTAANNGASAMCVDCHTVQPKAGGSHYVNASNTAGATFSGGAGNTGTNGVIATRDDGAYFKVTLWNFNTTGVATYSKYRTGTASVVPNNTVNGVKSAGVNATLTAYAAFDIICESCHNVIVNVAGGNNLLATQPTANDFEDAPRAELCVGCHGFMYAVDATGNAGNTNYSLAMNTNEVAGSGRRGNNEVHWIKGSRYIQNHHVMTDDDINTVTAGAGLLWTDNVVVSYTDAPISNTSGEGTYPQKGTWTISGAANVKPAGGGLNCTNCHTPAHGMNGGLGASILRGATYTVARGAGDAAIARLGDAVGSDVFKKINDLTYCNQCHQ